MNVFGTLAGVVLVFGSGVAVAAPVFDISGLHIEMPFNDGVAQAEKLGGICQLSTSRGEDAVYAECDYSYCEDDPATPCDKQNLETESAIAAQHIV